VTVARILLIDDDADLRHFLQSELEGQGHAVRCLEQAEHGPEVLSEAPFDLVLLDNKMPGMSGIDFLEALQDRALGVPVILMTGYSTYDTAIRAMNLGAFDYVIKPDDFQKLFRDLERLIAEALEITRPAKDVRVVAEAPPRPPAGPTLVGKSRPMVEVYKLVGRFARGDDAVLILGETGTGKELVALQPNMDIKLHIVAPEARKAKVMEEIQRPVFSLLEKGPLSEYCTFLPYGSLRELANLKHLEYMSDEVLDQYAEGPD
jgi:DNA-binding NtrC family response regulator